MAADRSAIKGDSNGSPGATLAQYTYLGPDQVVIQDLPEPDIKLDLFGGTSGTYAGLDRFDRGELNATKTGITGTPSREEDWTLDPLGNWSGCIQETDGTTDLDQERTVNEVNEITDITETTAAT